MPDRSNCGNNFCIPRGAPSNEILAVSKMKKKKFFIQNYNDKLCFIERKKKTCSQKTEKVACHRFFFTMSILLRKRSDMQYETKILSFIQFFFCDTFEHIEISNEKSAIKITFVCMEQLTWFLQQISPSKRIQRFFFSIFRVPSNDFLQFEK